MKKLAVFLTVISSIFLITSCEKESNEEDEKKDYLALKSELVSQDAFDDGEDINCSIQINIDRIDEETISYTTVISNPKEDMHNIKLLIIHNYFTEEIFPTVGIFDETKELLINEDKKITLVGFIDTSKDIKDLNLEFKIWIEYTDNDGEIEDIYYKTTK